MINSQAKLYEIYQTVKYYQKNPDKFNSLLAYELKVLELAIGSYIDNIRHNIDMPNPNLTKLNKNAEWKAYKKKVRNITKLQPVHTLENAEKPKVTCSEHLKSKEHYVIDHKISIWYGFHNNIPPEEIGDIKNLRYISSYDNCIKGIKCVFD